MITDLIDDDICKAQQHIFEYAVSKGYDLKNFAEEYLKSDFCRRAFDTPYSGFQTADAEECADFFMPEIEGRLFKGKGEYDLCAGGIGYVYRMLYIFTSVPSKELVSIVPFDEVADETLTTIHYSYEHVTENIIQRHNLPLKRYDCDVPRLSDEDIKEIERKSALEHEMLERKYLRQT